MQHKIAPKDPLRWNKRSMRQRELLEFRTPQHPSFGTNNWGGSSPLLARNIPKASLDQRYLRLNTIRDRDQIFPSTTIEEAIFSSPVATIGDEIFSFTKADVPTKYEYSAAPRRKGIIGRLTWRPRRQSVLVLGPNSKSRFKWLPKMDSKRRWPNGWC